MEELFDIKSDYQRMFEDLLARLESAADEVAAEVGYPKRSLIVKKNQIKSETNYPIVIREKPFPFGDSPDAQCVMTTVTVLRLKTEKSKHPGCVSIEVGFADYKADRIPSTADVKPTYKVVETGECDSDGKAKKTKEQDGFEIFLQLCDAETFCYLRELMKERLVNHVTTQPSFGCCHLYEKCSDAKKCLHENLMYAKACSYRKNLESGKIFYGANKNV